MMSIPSESVVLCVVLRMLWTVRIDEVKVIFIVVFNELPWYMPVHCVGNCWCYRGRSG